MSLATLLPFAAVLAAVCLTLGVAGLMQRGRSRSEERLEELKDPRRREKGDRSLTGAKTGLAGAVERAAPKMSKALAPKTEEEQGKLRMRLHHAGKHSAAAPQVFLAIKLAVSLGALALGSGYGFANYGMNLNGAMALIFIGGLGFYIPDLVLALMIKSRKDQIFLGMPDSLDLLVVCVEAGLGLDAGMRKVAEELADAHPAVCEELDLCNAQLQLGRPRRTVLHDLGVRTGVDDMRTLAGTMIQAERFGSSVGKALRTQSEAMRTKRRQLAEERAQQTAVKLIFPLVLFIFPGIFVVLIGPAALMIIDGLGM